MDNGKLYVCVRKISQCCVKVFQGFFFFFFFKLQGLSETLMFMHMMNFQEERMYCA